MALLLYSPNLVANRASIGVRLMRAYLHAQESYRAALGSSEGRAALRAELALALGLDAPRSGEGLNLLAYPLAGEPRLVSLSALQEYYSGAGLLSAHADLAQAVDLSFEPGRREGSSRDAVKSLVRTPVRRNPRDARPGSADKEKPRPRRGAFLCPQLKRLQAPGDQHVLQLVEAQRHCVAEHGDDD